MNEVLRAELFAMGLVDIARDVLLMDCTYFKSFFPKDYEHLKQFVLYVVLDSVQE